MQCSADVVSSFDYSNDLILADPLVLKQLEPSLCCSFSEASSSSSSQSQDRENSGNTHCTELAKVDVVLGLYQTPGSYFASKTGLPACFMLAGFTSKPVEAQVLRNRGLCDPVILTLPKS